MKLDDFIEEFFSNLSDREGIDNIKRCVKENTQDFQNYDTAKVEFQVFKGDDNFDCNVSISSEGYDDGNIVFIDSHIDS